MPIKCCPGSLVYVDPFGKYFNSCTGTLDTVLTWSDGVVSGIYDKCVLIQCAPAAYGATQEPVDCPCCPQGYTWISAYGSCMDTVTYKTRIDPIPCPVCDPCPVPPDPPVCDTCDSDKGEHKSFTYNNTIKNCTECDVQGEPQGLGNGADGFIPISLLDPIINFLFRT